MTFSGRFVQYTAAMIASLTFFMSGSFTCWTSPALPKLMEEYKQITHSESKWVISLLGVGCVIAPLPAGRLADFYGRKIMLVTAAVPFLVAWIMLIFAKTAPVLYVSRIIGGIGIGISITVCPIYIGEIADRQIRGNLESFIQLFQNFGSLFAFCLGPYMSHRMLSVVSLLVPVCYLILMLFMPETPYFCIMKDNVDEAERSLSLLRGQENVQEELADIKNEIEHEKRHKVTMMKLFASGGNRKALCIVGALALIQQLSGIMVILSQAETIFKATGNTLKPSEGAMVLGALQLVASIGISVLVDRLGRRPLLLLSTSGTALSLLVVGLCTYLQRKTDVSVSGWLPMFCLMFFIVVYCLGLGPIPLAMVGELFPTNLKEWAASFGSMIIALGFFAATNIYQTIALKAGIYYSFWISALFCCWGVIFTIFFVPETKGKSLIQILIELRSFVPDEVIKADVGCLECAPEAIDELERHFSILHTEEGLILETKNDADNLSLETLYSAREMQSEVTMQGDEYTDERSLVSHGDDIIEEDHDDNIILSNNLNDMNNESSSKNNMH